MVDAHHGNPEWRKHAGDPEHGAVAPDRDGQIGLMADLLGTEDVPVARADRVGGVLVKHYLDPAIGQKCRNIAYRGAD